MTEDMHEELSAGLEPGADAPEQFTVVTHVLEHFHRNNSVEALFSFEFVHIGGDDPQVGKPAAVRLLVYVLPLRRGVGDSGDFAFRIMGGHPQGQ